jgi:uncharacterized phiE125 gp8 family phage protein
MKLRSYQPSVLPTSEPLSLSEAKLHLRVDGDDEDELIGSLITAAREYCETSTNRQFVTATFVGKLDEFPTELENGWYEITLPRPPLQSVSSITYVDTAGATQTLSAGVYAADTSIEPGRVRLAYNQTWPTIRTQPNAISITFVAGYGDAADVPESIRAAMKLILGHLYANREAVNVGNIVNEFPIAVDALLSRYSLPEVY